MANNNSNVKGYKINFGEGTITMNYKFASAAEIYGSPEYELLKAIRNDFPNFKVITKAGRKIKTPRKTKRMTYENMEKYIRTFVNANELMEIFEIVKHKSLIVKSPYKYVLAWFKNQFPNYSELPEKVEVKNKVTPIAIPNAENYEKEVQKVS